MADKRGGVMAFIVGGLVVAVAVIAWALYSGRTAAPEPPTVDVDVQVPTPRLPDGPPRVDPPPIPAPTPTG